MLSSKGIHIEDKQIEAVKQWPKPLSIRDIQMFLGFANFYRRFIQEFSWIAAPLTSMLKTSITKSAGPKKGRDKVDGDSRAERGQNKIHRSRMDNVEVEVDEIGKKVRNLSKSKNSSKSKRTVKCSDFLILGAKLAFTKLRQAFFKALILYLFHLELHIWIETDASGYTIDGVLSHLTLNDSGRWHPVVFFFCKMILTETKYETHDGELLAIVEALKTWRYYLEGSQHEVLIFTDYNNLRQLMDIKSLSSRQVHWAQELSRYQFQIDYCQGKANEAVDALSRYPQQSAEEKEILSTENVKILHHLQFLLAKVVGFLANSSHLSPFHQVLICGTTVLPQLHQFWDSI